MSAPGDSSIPLSTLKPGARGRVAAVRGGRGFNQRLASMGILPGAEILFVKGNAAGPVIVEVRGGRFILGRGMVHRVRVEPAGRGES